MGTTKSDIFGESQNQLANWAKALGHPARIAIVQHLLNKPGCMCGDIVVEIPLAQSTISQHLKALKESGLIKGEIDGPKVCYCIDHKAWEEARLQLGGFFQKIGDPDTCC